MKLSNIKINGKKEPIGYDFSNLRIAWQISDTSAKEIQNTKIEIAADEEFSEIVFEKEGNLMQTGEGIDAELSGRTRYFVRVTAEGDNGEIAGDVSFFETAKMDEAWTAKWIAPQEGDAFHPVFHKEFFGEKKSEMNIKRARLYISGLGMYQAMINDKPVTDEMLTPYYSDYRTEIQYQTYDVTALLSERNEISVLLGNGWYKGKFGLGHTENNFGDTFLLLAELT